MEKAPATAPILRRRRTLDESRGSSTEAVGTEKTTCGVNMLVPSSSPPAVRVGEQEMKARLGLVILGDEITLPIEGPRTGVDPNKGTQIR